MAPGARSAHAMGAERGARGGDQARRWRRGRAAPTPWAPSAEREAEIRPADGAGGGGGRAASRPCEGSEPSVRGAGLLVGRVVKGFIPASGRDRDLCS